MGEGGAVLTNSNGLKLELTHLSWGRDCWCKGSHDDTCGKVDWQLEDLPYGYDHKFTYSNIRYNQRRQIYKHQ